jgi:hypothetical protein
MSWHRTIRGKDVVNLLFSQLRHVGIGLKRVNRIDESKVGIPPTVAAVRTLNRNFLVNAKFASLKEAYDVIGHVEKSLKAVGLEVRYETKSDALQRLKKRQADAVLVTPKPIKEAIVETARSGKVFACKTTRHIIPARPMHLCVPLNSLKNSRSMSEINEELKIMLQKKRLRHISPGSVFEGRRYEEDLYVFEESSP